MSKYLNSNKNESRGTLYSEKDKLQTILEKIIFYKTTPVHLSVKKISVKFWWFKALFNSAWYEVK